MKLDLHGSTNVEGTRSRQELFFPAGNVPFDRRLGRGPQHAESRGNDIPSIVRLIGSTCCEGRECRLEKLGPANFCMNWWGEVVGTLVPSKADVGF